MSINKSDAIQNSNFNKLPWRLIDLISDFLMYQDAGRFHGTAHIFRYSGDKVQQILAYIFAGNPKAIEQFFKNNNMTPDILLKPGSFQEGYNSKAFGRFICFRFWRQISPLQAAISTGDIFIFKDFLDCILKAETKSLQSETASPQADTESPRLRAIKQLKAIQKRITDQTMIITAAINILHSEIDETEDIKREARQRLNEIQNKADFKAQMDAFGKEMGLLRSQIMTEKNESKALKQSSERTNSVKDTNAYAEDCEFLEPILKLITAYVYRYINYAELIIRNDFEELAHLGEYIGEWHRRLFRYTQQIFFDSEPFSIDAQRLFENPPNRRPCAFFGNKLFSQDDFGIGTTRRLERGCLTECINLSGIGVGQNAGNIDMITMVNLYKLRRDGLRDTVHHLEFSSFKLS